jgi:hypothetical protein
MNSLPQGDGFGCKKISVIKISVTTQPYSLLIPGELGADSVISQGYSLRQGVALFFCSAIA